MRLFILFSLFLGLSAVSNGQRNCLSGVYQVPNLVSQANNSKTESTITIPVVVHVIYNAAAENISEAQIISQIKSLNEDFSLTNADFIKVPAVFAKVAANTNIKFELAKTDPSGRATTGITRKKTTRLMWSDDNKIKSSSYGTAPWDTRAYLNIWVCNTVPGLTGYATFPGSDPVLDGIVIRYDAFGTTGTLMHPYNKGRTLTHEVGHWMGLKHLWGDGPCGDDGIADTPKQRGGNSGDPVFPRQTPCNGSAEGEMFMNFMDFSNDASMGMFTQGQKSVMRAQFEAKGARASIVQSKGLAAAWNTVSEPEALITSTVNVDVYPNPVAAGNMKIRVNVPMGVNGRHFSIISASGNIIRTGHMKESQQDVDVHSLNPGVYSIRLTDQDSNLYTKFVKL